MAENKQIDDQQGHWQADDDFADIEAEEAGDSAVSETADKWMAELDFDKKGSIKSTASNIIAILENDPRLKNHIWQNLFNGFNYITGGLPWNAEATQWGNTDDANLRIYLDEKYGVTGKDKIKDALVAVVTRHRIHPIRDYLNSLKWDGVPRSYAGHNQDQTLQTAMRNSTVWVYEGLAKQIGTAREQQYLQRIQYGNQNASGAVDKFWLNDTLQISAQEQLLFLQQLYREQLPFSVAHQRLVKQLIQVDSGQNWSLHAKTGWSGSIGWWVGWVQQPTGAVFFALNIDTPLRMADLAKRESITRAILREIAALPPTAKR